MYKRLLLLAGIAALPFSGHAQGFIGLGASMLTSRLFSSYDDPNLYGGTISGGVQLTPHTALQLEVGYNGRTTTGASAYYPSTSTYENRTRVLLVPLLFRYTFADPEKPFHLDGLAGFTFYHSAFHSTQTTTGPSQVLQTYEYDSSANRLCASLGPSVRYALSPQLELSAAGVVNAVLNDSFNSFSDRLFLNAQLGLHYTFGQR